MPTDAVMEIPEIYADAAGVTHFRTLRMSLARKDYAPPSKSVFVSADLAVTTSLFLAAPPGWDENPHPTPRRQLAVLLEGELVMTTSDGDSLHVTPGNVVVLGDTVGAGHVTVVQGSKEARFLLVGLADGEVSP